MSRLVLFKEKQPGKEYLLLTLCLLLISSCHFGPVESRNIEPEILYVTATKTNLEPSEKILLNADAYDEDGDELEFNWDANSGSFPEGNYGESVFWIAPDVKGAYLIWLKVVDKRDTVSESLSILVGLACPGIKTVVIDNFEYNTVQIGEQCWLQRNLNIGEMIDGRDTSTNNGVIEKYCYDDDQTNCDKYGGLYRWDEALQYTDSSGTQGICPEGWHIPAANEFRQLVQTVSNNSSKLRIDGDVLTGRGNESGFSALLTGYMSTYGSFKRIEDIAYFWSSSESGQKAATAMFFYEIVPEVLITPKLKNEGFSIRCLKNQ